MGRVILQRHSTCVILAPVRAHLAASLGGVLVLVGAGLLVSAASAQDASDVQAAAAAFGEAQRAQLRGDYARAAELFDVADRSAPSPEALRSAIRNYRAATRMARAATLSARALERYPDDVETRGLAEEVLAEAAPVLGRVQVQCEPACALTVDGRAAWHEEIRELALFVAPGTHRLAASWSEGGDVSRELELRAGTSEVVSLTPLERATEPAEPEPQSPALEVTSPPPAEAGGIDPVFFGIGAAVTAVGLGLTIWSGIDTLAARDAYVASPTQSGYEAGVGLEWRTNGLLFGTLAFAATSAVLALFTDFGGGAAIDVAITPAPGGAHALLSGRFEGVR